MDCRRTLTPVGDNFNPFGYSLVFRNKAQADPSGYLTFNMAINDIKASKQMITIDNSTAPLDLVGACTSNAASGAVVLEVRHILGIVVMTAIFFFLGILFGVIENFIGFFIRICPCCPKPNDDNDIFEMTEDFDNEEEEEEEEADPLPPSLDNLDSDMTVSESLLELQVRGCCQHLAFS